jgi:hypothetical protein
MVYFAFLILKMKAKVWTFSATLGKRSKSTFPALEILIED